MWKSSLLVIFVYLLVCFTQAQPEGPASTPEDGGEGPAATPEDGGEGPVATPEDGGEGPAATPEEGPAATPEEGPAATPEEGPAATPEEGPAATPEEGPAATPEEGPAATPEEGPAATPEEGPAATPEGPASVPEGPDSTPEGPEDSIPTDFPPEGLETQCANVTEFTPEAWLCAINGIRTGLGLNELSWNEDFENQAFCYNASAVRGPGQTDSFVLPSDTTLSVVRVWLAAQGIFNPDVEYSCSRVTLLKQCQFFYQLTFPETETVGCSTSSISECEHVVCFFDPPANCDNVDNCVYGPNL